mmetsp:Transcript_77158/g.151121  ORF Transcript_77158/g.151121 Transcript_77158/m.151121 type:complete len:256 (+) Transcript_77158:98-865(+)
MDVMFISSYQQLVQCLGQPKTSTTLESRLITTWGARTTQRRPLQSDFAQTEVVVMDFRVIASLLTLESSLTLLTRRAVHCRPNHRRGFTMPKVCAQGICRMVRGETCSCSSTMVVLSQLQDTSIAPNRLRVNASNSQHPRVARSRLRRPNPTAPVETSFRLPPAVQAKFQSLLSYSPRLPPLRRAAKPRLQPLHLPAMYHLAAAATGFTEWRSTQTKTILPTRSGSVPRDGTPPSTFAPKPLLFLAPCSAGEWVN